MGKKSVYILGVDTDLTTFLSAVGLVCRYGCCPSGPLRRTSEEGSGNTRPAPLTFPYRSQENFRRWFLYAWHVSVHFITQFIFN